MKFGKLRPGKNVSGVFALIFLYSLSSLAQSHIKGMKVLRMPKVYLEPTGKLAEPNAKEAEGPYDYWKVFCDRDGNSSYKEAALTTAWKKIDFMQVYFVLERKGNALHLAQYTNLLTDKYNIPNDSLDFGWVDQNKMLLWKNCLIDSTYGFSVKGLVIRDAKVLQDSSEFQKLATEKFPLYNSPDLKSRNKNDIDLFDFLYIYKYERGSYLVGKQEIMTPQGVATDMLGWVPEKYIRKWSQRLCLEPNAEKSAQAERKSIGAKANIYASEEQARKWMAGENVKSLNSEDLGLKEMLPAEKRLPIISDLNAGIIKTGYITPIFDKKGDKIITTAEQAANEKKYNLSKDNYRTINIVFVVEGSDVLKSYVNSIISSIQTTSDRAKMDLKSTYRFGAVVYRNYSSPDNEICTFQDLSSSCGPVKSFLQSEFQKSNSGSYVKGSAMYAGIQKAVRLFPKAEQTNYIIVIGYSGNELSAKSPNEISMNNDIASMHASLVSFQVQYCKQDEQAFQSQTKSLILESAKKIKSQTDKVKMNKVTTKGITFVQTDVHTNNEFSLQFPGGDSPVPGMYTTASPNRPNRPEWIGDQIVELIGKRSRDNDKILADWDASIKGIGNTSARMSEELYLLLLNSNIDPSYFKKLDSNSNVQIFIEGYAAIKKNNQQRYPNFNFVLFINDEELNDLITTFKKLGDVNTPSETRSHLVNCYREMVQSYFGARESKKAFAKKSLAELNQIITGLPSSSDLFKKYSIGDIENNKIPLNTLSEIVDQLNQIKTDLSHIKSNSINSFVNYDQRYFWIPANVFH